MGEVWLLMVILIGIFLLAIVVMTATLLQIFLKHGEVLQKRWVLNRLIAIAVLIGIDVAIFIYLFYGNHYFGS